MNNEYNDDGVKLNDFSKQSKTADNEETRRFMDGVYKQFFTKEIGHIKRTPLIKDYSQTVGIDTRVWFSQDDRPKWCEEKHRFVIYRDFLLELECNGKPGWMYTDYKCDLLVYVFHGKVKSAYFFWWNQFDRMWKQNEEEWLRIYGRKNAWTPVGGHGYSTENLVVPLEVLLQAYQDAGIVSPFTECERDQMFEEEDKDRVEAYIKQEKASAKALEIALKKIRERKKI